FHNEYVLLLDVYVPPNRGGPMYHTYSLDQVSVLTADSDITNQVWGGEETPSRRGPRGHVGFVAQSKKPVSHRGSNVGTTPFHTSSWPCSRASLMDSPREPARACPRTRRWSTMSGSVPGKSRSNPAKPSRPLRKGLRACALSSMAAKSP